MSYILEALRRSERERARGKIPTLQTVSRPGLSQKSLWLGVVIGAGALSLLVATSWLVHPQLFRWPPSTTDGAVTGTASGQQSSTAVDEQPETAQSEAAEVPTQQEQASTKSTRVTEAGELDSTARRRLEGLSVNVVSYSDVPERRFVMLNQRIVRESDTVAEGILVKRIMPEGVLLVVDDYEILIRPD